MMGSQLSPLPQPQVNPKIILMMPTIGWLIVCSPPLADAEVAAKLSSFLNLGCIFLGILSRSGPQLHPSTNGSPQSHG